MKKNLKKMVNWLLLGVAFGILTAVCFLIEGKSGGRYRLTAGSGLITAICLAAAIWSLMGKMNSQAGRLIVEDVFKMKAGGCVVVGSVQGVLAAGQKVMVHDREDRSIQTKICGIEINRKKTKVAANTPAALYFKEIAHDKIHKGDIICSME